MAWAAITEPMIFEEAQELSAQYELSCVSIKQSERRLQEIHIRPVVSRFVTNYEVYNYFEDGSYWRTSAASDVRSYAVYYYVPGKVRYNELLGYIYKHLLPLKGKYTPILLWQTSEGERFIYSWLMGVFHAPVYAAFSNPLFYFETSTIPESPWEKKILREITETKKD